MNVFSPQVLATWRLYLFAVKVPTKVNVPPLSVEFYGSFLSCLDLRVIHQRCDRKLLSESKSGEIRMTTAELIMYNVTNNVDGFDESVNEVMSAKKEL